MYRKQKLLLTFMLLLKQSYGNDIKYLIELASFSWEKKPTNSQPFNIC